MSKKTIRPVRPVLLISEQTVSHYPTVLARLLVGLADQSIPVVLVCPPQCEVQSLLFGAVEVIRYPGVVFPLAERFDRKRLMATLGNYDLTVLHCLCETKASLARMLARHLDIPYVLTINSLHARRTGLSVSSKRCVSIACPTASIARSMRGLYPHLAERVSVIGFGTFVENGCCCFSNANELPSIVMACDLRLARDFECVFKAISDLVLDHYEFSVIVMGQGRAESAIRQMMAQMGLQQTVTIVPELHPWRSVLSAGDIYLVPQPLSRFCSYLLETMSVGVAVAGCKGGVDDLLVNKQTAEVFDSNDPVSIRVALQTLLGCHEYARTLALGAQDFLRMHYSVSRMVEKVMHTYDQATEWAYGLDTISEEGS